MAFDERVFWKEIGSQFAALAYGFGGMVGDLRRDPLSHGKTFTLELRFPEATSDPRRWPLVVETAVAFRIVKDDNPRAFYQPTAAEMMAEVTRLLQPGPRRAAGMNDGEFEARGARAVLAVVWPDLKARVRAGSQ